jgi:protein HOOK3
MTQYFTDVLQKPTSTLDVPDLQAIAKDYNVSATLIMCRLTIAIGVQCEQNKQFIDKIQELSEADQHHLMKAIEQVSSAPFSAFRVKLAYRENQTMARITVMPGNGDEAGTTEYVRFSSFYSLPFKRAQHLETIVSTAYNQNEVRYFPRKRRSRKSTKRYWRNSVSFK